jgi:transposase
MILIRWVDMPSVFRWGVKATGSWYYFYEVLEDTGAEIFLAHPLRTRDIAEARIKTDTIDSTIIAHLLARTSCLPHTLLLGGYGISPRSCGSGHHW